MYPAVKFISLYKNKLELCLLVQKKFNFKHHWNLPNLSGGATTVPFNSKDNCIMKKVSHIAILIY